MAHTIHAEIETGPDLALRLRKMLESSGEADRAMAQEVEYAKKVAESVNVPSVWDDVRNRWQPGKRPEVDLSHVRPLAESFLLAAYQAAEVLAAPIAAAGVAWVQVQIAGHAETRKEHAGQASVHVYPIHDRPPGPPVGYAEPRK